MMIGIRDKVGDRTRKAREILCGVGGTFSADWDRYQRIVK